jgi:FimV-like protein
MPIRAPSRFKSSEFIDLNDPESTIWIPPRSCAASAATASIWIWTGWRRSGQRRRHRVAAARGRRGVLDRSVRGQPAQPRVDLDVGEALSAMRLRPTNKLQAQTHRLKPVDLGIPELEPVTMSEVGTKLDLARAYMDMGDPEGARSILEEVVQEGSASQKQEAQRLIENRCPVSVRVAARGRVRRHRLCRLAVAGACGVHTGIGGRRRSASSPATRQRRSAPVAPMPASMPPARSFISKPPPSARPGLGAGRQYQASADHRPAMGGRSGGISRPP